MNSYTKVCKHHPVHEYFRSSSNKHEYVIIPTMQLQNKYYLQPNSCFARKLHWKGDVTQNHACMA